jgi:serine/threonine-protein kinase
MTLGTPTYMSPEQAAGSRDLDRRSDVYSLGCVLYEMLAGQPPFTGPTAQSLMHQHLSVGPPSVANLRPAVPEWIASAIQRSMAKNPADRFGAIGEFAAALGGRANGSLHSTMPMRSASPVRRPASLALLAISAAVVVAIGAWLMLRPGHRPATTSPVASPAHARTEIAVLPFQNLSADAEHAYFAGGLQDELLTQLSQVASLKVISRTSVMGYQGFSKPLKTIAAELGVGSVVEGSVQVAGRRLRVTVQLIDAATDEHLWAQHYDRKLDDAFAIQSEVARKIVSAVGAVLTESEQGRLGAPPTANAEAYRLYLQGLEYWHRPGLSRENWVTAQQLFEQTVKLDPKFALAHAQLSQVNGTLFWLRYDSPAEQTTRKLRQRAEAEEALRLAPDLPQAHEAMAIAYFYGSLDFTRALRELDIARQGLPNDADIWRWIAVVHRRSGHMDEATSAAEKAIQLNPRDADIYADDAGRTYKIARRYGEAIRSFEQALELAPDLEMARLERGLTFVLWRGRLDSLDATLNRISAEADLGPYGTIAGQRAELRLLQRDARVLLQMPQVAGNEWFASRFVLFPGSLYAAWAHQLLGEPAAARAAFALALSGTDSARTQNPGDWRAHAATGLALAGLGRRAEAEREAEWLKQSFTYRNDAVDGPDLGEARAKILAQAGDVNAALDEIERLLSHPAFFSVQSLKLDPRWDPIRNQPRFQAMLERFGAK